MSKKEKESLGTVSKNRAIKIFEALGFKTASKWDATRLQKKLAKLSTLIDGADLDSKTQKRVNEILRAQKKGRKVTVVDTENVAADKKRGQAVKDAAKREIKRKTEKEVETAKKEKGAAKKKVKEVAAAKKQEKRIAEKTVRTKREKKDADKFGSQKGGNIAKLNAVLSKKPKTLKELCEKAGLEIKGMYYNHLNYKLVEAKFVKKTGKKYSLA